MEQSILVIGATGKTGSELVRLLSGKNLSVVAATRNPDLARKHLPAAVRAVLFNYDLPATFAPALDGVERIFLMARPTDPHADRAALPFLQEAKKHGVKFIVNLSAIGVERVDAFVLRILERYVEDSGIPCTHLRPNWFMQNFSSPPMVKEIQATGLLRLPAGDALISFVDIRDVAAVACEVLTNPRHSGKAYTLTGGEALSHFHVAEALSRAAGKPIAYEPISESSARTLLNTAHIPPDIIERWIQFYAMVRDGFCAEISESVGHILGRQPIPFSQFARDNAAAWQ